MTNRDIFRELTFIDPALVVDASPKEGKRKPKLSRRWLKWGGLAACICLIAVLAIHIKVAFTPAQMTDVFREGIGLELTDLDQLPAEYDGTLLVKNLDVDAFEFYYKEGGDPSNIEDWYSLLLLEHYRGSKLMLHCMFGDLDIEDWKVDMVFTKKATVTRIIHGVEVQIARRELSLNYEYVYYAIFKYDGVVYDLRTESNEAEYIYEILDILLRDQT
ncbi:MAG: hypothetical protein IJA91_06660 [Clostridia bacterium]|nr:hypothetical protein [Clostridia bacterium]